MHPALVSLLCIVIANACFAAPRPTEPPSGGTVLVKPEALLVAKTTGKEYAKVATVAVEGMPFNKAIRVEVTERPVKYYHVQAKIMQGPAVKEGDVLLASFWARLTGGGTLETANGEIRFGIQRKEDNKVMGGFIAQPNGEWQRFYVPIKAHFGVAAGEATVTLSFGAMLQTIEVGGLELTSYGDKLAVTDLPETVVTYIGREDDAEWRKEANARIEKIRKGDLTVTVVDAAGRPIPDADVHVLMQKHAFQFGAAVTARAVENSEITRPILETHRKLFNQGVNISWMYWRDIDDPKATANADRLYTYFRENGMIARAHALMYERPDLQSSEVTELIQKGDKEKLRVVIKEYITRRVTQFKGRVDEWVVENEAVDNLGARAVLGEAAIADFFKWAKAADPNVRLMINENRLEGLKPDKTDKLLAIVKTIVDNGGPLDTIGIQGHMQNAPVAPVTLLKHFDRLAATGKRLAVTEYDFVSDDEQMKADYMRDFLTACFSHPSFDCVTFWRMWDGQPHKKESVIFAHDWSLKPSGHRYIEMVFNRWWTNKKGKTDATGSFATRAFGGAYKITVTANGKTQTVPATVKWMQANAVTITLK
jgi:GH35 family endo-1,4-beta-xylanase